AMCVGRGTGLFRSFAEAADAWVKTEIVFEPHKETNGIYLQQYDRWRRVFTEFMKIVDQGDLSPMWKAPGT
ncbi:MAG: autoinducer-2 kinase, partial [Terriglobia bacterium]